ncbi:uncharacterized protein LOC143450273 [Clavelina lepadiformis]|uniref:uncharacterized protein LOC143450273 n=1 Tax=Clavelina lepadiformis TaxID=159417 RepID=UPI0040414E7D
MNGCQDGNNSTSGSRLHGNKQVHLKDSTCQRKLRICCSVDSALDNYCNEETVLQTQCVCRNSKLAFLDETITCGFDIKHTLSLKAYTRVEERISKTFGIIPHRIDDETQCAERSNFDCTFAYQRNLAQTESCQCQVQRWLQCRSHPRSTDIFDTNLTMEPLYSYPPVRCKRTCLYSGFRKLLYFSSHLQSSRRISISVFCRFFLFFMLLTLPIHSSSSKIDEQQSKNVVHKRCAKTGQETTSHHLRNYRTLYTEAGSCSRSFSNRTLFCQQLPHCLPIRNTYLWVNPVLQGNYHFTMSNISTTLPDKIFVVNASASMPVNQEDVNRRCGVSTELKQMGYKLFCQGIPLYKLFKNDLICFASQPNSCIDELEKIEEADKMAEKYYNQFFDVMFRYATPYTYSTIGNKDNCLAAYKKWICSVSHDVYEYNETCHRNKSPWCPSICSKTEQNCPFFRVFNDTKLRGGQPVFICRGYDVMPTDSQTDQSCSRFSTTEDENKTIYNNHPTTSGGKIFEDRVDSKRNAAHVNFSRFLLTWFCVFIVLMQILIL